MTNLRQADSTKGAPSKTPQKQRWKTILSITAMLVWTGISVIVAQLAVGGVMIGVIGVESFGQPVVQAIYAALSYMVAMLLAIWVPASSSMEYRKVDKSGKKKTVRLGSKTKSSASRNALGLKGWPTWTDIGLAPVGYIISILLAAGLVAVFSLFPWFDAGEDQEIGFDLYASGVDRVIAFIALVVIAPIAEEIIFRGWLYGWLRNKLSRETSNMASMIISALLVSVLFGVVHLQWNVGVTVFAMSLVLCGLREVTGTIYAGILMHMLKNGLAMWILCMWGGMI